MGRGDRGLGFGLVALLMLGALGYFAPGAQRGVARAYHFPADYYASIDTSRPLRPQLHDLIDDHTRLPYPAEAGGGVLDIVRLADQESARPGFVRTIYRNSVLHSDHYPESWNREHAWPSSYGFSKDRRCNYPYADAHHIFVADAGYNSSRGNLVFDFCREDCTEKPADEWPGRPNLRKGRGASGAWEVWLLRRGDIARAILYMDVRYEGDEHSDGCAEPDLVATSDRSLIEASEDNENRAHMGILGSLVVWSLQDRVDDRERDRNEVVYSHQGNRNPFVDHPEWVCELWECGAAFLPHVAVH